jgi:hypothetical protein
MALSDQVARNIHSMPAAASASISGTLSPCHGPTADGGKSGPSVAPLRNGPCPDHGSQETVRRSAFVLFDVIDQDGTRNANRKVATAELDMLDASARADLKKMRKGGRSRPFWCIRRP